MWPEKSLNLSELYLAICKVGKLGSQIFIVFKKFKEKARAGPVSFCEVGVRKVSMKALDPCPSHLQSHPSQLILHVWALVYHYLKSVCDFPLLSNEIETPEGKFMSLTETQVKVKL
jgi:hypothetical protein